MSNKNFVLMFFDNFTIVHCYYFDCFQFSQRSWIKTLIFIKNASIYLLSQHQTPKCIVCKHTCTECLMPRQKKSFILVEVVICSLNCLSLASQHIQEHSPNGLFQTDKDTHTNNTLLVPVYFPVLFSI